MTRMEVNPFPGWTLIETVLPEFYLGEISARHRELFDDVLKRAQSPGGQPTKPQPVLFPKNTATIAPSERNFREPSAPAAPGKIGAPERSPSKAAPAEADSSGAAPAEDRLKGPENAEPHDTGALQGPDSQTKSAGEKGIAEEESSSCEASETEAQPAADEVPLQAVSPDGALTETAQAEIAPLARGLPTEVSSSESAPAEAVTENPLHAKLVASETTSMLSPPLSDVAADENAPTEGSKTASTNAEVLPEEIDLSKDSGQRLAGTLVLNPDGSAADSSVSKRTSRGQSQKTSKTAGGQKVSPHRPENVPLPNLPGANTAAVAADLITSVGAITAGESALPTGGIQNTGADAAGKTAVESPSGTLARQGATGAARVSGNAGESPNSEANAAVDRVRFVQRVERAFAAVGNRNGSVRLRLSPPELGSLRLEITVRKGVLKARLEAETPAAKNLLLENLTLLRERLAQQDVKVQQFDVDLMDHSGGGASEQKAPHADSGASQDGYRLPHSADAEAASPAESAAGSRRWPGDEGQLDVLV